MKISNYYRRRIAYSKSTLYEMYEYTYFFSFYTSRCRALSLVLAEICRKHRIYACHKTIDSGLTHALRVLLVRRQYRNWPPLCFPSRKPIFLQNGRLSTSRRRRVMLYSWRSRAKKFLKTKNQISHVKYSWADFDGTQRAENSFFTSSMFFFL